MKLLALKAVANIADYVAMTSERNKVMKEYLCLVNDISMFTYRPNNIRKTYEFVYNDEEEAG